MLKNAFRRNDVRISLAICFIALFAISLLWKPGVVTVAQEKSAATFSEASSLPDALTAGMTISKDIAVPIDNVPVADSPSEVCGWTAGTAYPIPILDQATAVQGGFLYTFGGVSTSIISNAYKFDGSTWTPIAPLPAALEFPSAVSDGTFVYILGGALTGTGTPQTTMYRYDPVANSYTAMAPFTVGTWNQATVYLNGKIYKFAGTGPATSSTDALEIYTIATNTWAAGAPYPATESFVGAFVKDGFIYGAGGIDGATSTPTAKTYRYDPVGNTWSDAAIADLPATRWGAASSIVGVGPGSDWVLAGGYVAGSVTASISNTAIRWDDSTNQWLTLPNMLGERSRMTGGVLGSTFYVVGGRSVASPSFAGTVDNQKLTCLTNVAVIDAGTVSLVAESFPPGNGVMDPGETVTVSLPLSNSGDTATVNLIATLQATGGVTNPTPASQSYGAIAPGTTVTRNFTFTVSPSVACGGTVTLTWDLADGATSYGTVVRTFTTGIRASSLEENFDTVTPPALPAGWTTVQDVGTGITWTTTATGPSTPPNSAFANDPNTVNMSSLISPSVNITSASAQLSFKNKYVTESTFDGMVLEIKIGSGAWTDIVTAGGSFVSGGYNATISSSFQSPIAGRRAWSGTSAGGYITTLVNLPAAANGQSVQFAWKMASDSSVSSTGVNIDDVHVFGSYVCATAGTVRARADFDGDGKTDFSVFRPSDGNWYLYRSTAGIMIANWGVATDVPVPADYDNDGKTDIAVYRPSTGYWYVYRSSDNAVSVAIWGSGNDKPVAGDYDGDGKADFAIFRPSEGNWYIYGSSGGVVIANWGVSTDLPVQGDYDGDGKYDYAVFRPSSGLWLIYRSSDATVQFATWGVSTDKPVPADYDGDHKQDVAVYRPSTGIWYIYRSTDGQVAVAQWGNSTDLPVPGDYDGDGKTDYAIFRNGTWYLYQSTAGIVIANWGVAGDIPIPAKYIP